MDEFVIKLREFLKNIPRLSISADVSDHEVVLHAELITELFRAIQESVNNALKYADAENITVSIVADSANIAVRIADNGCGFDPQQKAKGFGLENMQYRMKSIGGSYELYSAPGKGTTVVLQAHLG
jgi:signal transduction histidine kinase